jgi:hypothetical protein
MPNTPKKYKGFSKLPEAVQQKMDPKAAMKYMEGGAVQPGSKRPPKRPNAMDGRRKGDIKTEELLAGMTMAEINAAIDSSKNPKKKRMDEEKRTKKRIIKESTRRRTRDHNTEPKQDIKSALGFANGGKVRGYKHGGGVSRGGGAAVSGTKFTGCK